MTVMVRPVPKRTASNGIRPFRPNIPANNIRPYTVKTWRPPVPEPLSPAPLLGPKELLALGLLVLAQLWGRLSSRSRNPAPNLAYPPGPTKAVGGNYVTLKSPIGGWASFAEFISLENTGRPGGYGTTYWKLTRRMADGTIQFNELPRSAEEIAAMYLECTSGRTCTTPTQVPTGLVPGAVPDVDPKPDPKPLPVPALPPKPAVPTTTPGPVPEVDPVPQEPGPSKPPIAPPITVPNSPGTTAPPKPGSVIVIRPDGTMPAPDPGETPTTNPDWHFPIPGAPPVTGNGPQATPEEMAKELGRLEQKLNLMLNPTPDTGIEWARWIPQIAEALFSLTAGKTYTLTEKCPPCDGSEYIPPTVTVNAPGSLSALGVIANKVDAVAALLDGQLGLKQQICPPCRPQVGDWVTVNFISDEISPGGEKRLRKTFRYRDQSGRAHLDHVLHWENFEWQAGPVCVISKNLTWGVPQVWAASAAEGQRVIRHAAEIAGVDLSVAKHKWVITGSSDARYGMPGTMRVQRRNDGWIRVSKRDGPSGLPKLYGPPSASP